MLIKNIYLALGSNLGNPLYQIDTAINAIDKIPHTTCITTSSLYCTLPYGPINQPDYLNIVIELESSLRPETLLDQIQRIELDGGRIRQLEQRWGPRTIDIDIILFGEEIINIPGLIIPHYDIQNRPFFLVPLLEIAPFLRFPNGKAIIDIITELDTRTVRPLYK